MYFITVALLALLYPCRCSITGLMTGDRNPPAYSVVNIDLDTLEKPPSVAKSVLGYVDAADGMHAN